VTAKPTPSPITRKQNSREQEEQKITPEAKQQRTRRTKNHPLIGKQSG
jgi:hypothetical protein